MTKPQQKLTIGQYKNDNLMKSVFLKSTYFNLRNIKLSQKYKKKNLLKRRIQLSKYHHHYYLENYKENAVKDRDQKFNRLPIKSIFSTTIEV